MGEATKVTCHHLRLKAHGSHLEVKIFRIKKRAIKESVMESQTKRSK